MRGALSLGVVVLAATCLSSCGGSGETSATVTVTAAATTSQKPAGVEIQAKAKEMNSILGQGCGALPKPPCDQSSQHLAKLAREVRKLMAESPNPTFYSPAIALAEKADSASAWDLTVQSNWTVLRSYVIKLVDWILAHPTA